MAVYVSKVPELVVPAEGFLPAPPVPQPNIFPDGVARRDREARRALRALEAARLQPLRLPVGPAPSRRFHPRAAHRNHVLVRGAREFRRLGPGRLRESDDPRVRNAHRGPGAQMLFLDHARRDESRRVLSARDSETGARRTALLRAEDRPRARRDQQHRVALSQRRPLLERLRRIARQVSARASSLRRS